MTRKIITPFSRNLGFLLVSFITLTACNVNSAVSPLPNVRLDQSTWVLTKMPIAPPNNSRPISLTFNNGKVAGFNGCNSYSASYVNHRDGTLALGRLSTSRMACSGAAGQIEQYFLRQLTQVRMYSLSRGQLQLLNDKRKILLSFKNTL